MDSVPISLLRQFVFCPRIPWFHLVESRRPPTPVWVRQGIDHDRAQQALAATRRYRRLGLAGCTAHSKPTLSSDRERIHGVPDLVLETNASVVVTEYKLRRPGSMNGARLQLAAYALVAAARWGKDARWAALITGRRMKVSWIAVTDGLIEQVRATVVAIETIRNTPLLPESPASGEKCAQCEFLRFCNDRF